MAGGTSRIQLDHADDYLNLRRDLYGFDYVPLPDSLALSAEDESFNRSSDWHRVAR
jgi:hypothetical protein